MLSYNTNTIKSIEIVELFQLFQIIFKILLIFAVLKMKTYLDLLLQQKKLEFNFMLCFPPQQQPLHGAVRKKKQIRCRKRRGGGKDSQFS